MDDERVFPSKLNVPFPTNYKEICRQMFRRLFRVYAHIYLQHIEDVRSLDEEEHLNTSFKLFVIFVKEFKVTNYLEKWNRIVFVGIELLT